jgi:NAD(P)-dependent dehydrogenase (short-subunit alcohol dehydrogenase family)
MRNLLYGKKILITDGSSGIGRATAVFCVSQGAHVIITGRDEKRLENTRGLCVDPTKCDVLSDIDLTQYDDICSLFHESNRLTGPVDGVVHSAGIVDLIPLRVITEAAYVEHFDIHVKSTFLIAKEFQRKKNYSDAGSLVIVSSVSAFSAAAAQSLYAAAKSAQIGLMKTLSIELIPKNIRVNAVAPADVNTGMSKNCLSRLSSEQYEKHVKNHPMGLGTAEDVAHGVAYLLSDYSRWVNGTTLFIDGGFSAK